MTGRGLLFLCCVFLFLFYPSFGLRILQLNNSPTTSRSLPLPPRTNGPSPSARGPPPPPPSPSPSPAPTPPLGGRGRRPAAALVSLAWAPSRYPAGPCLGWTHGGWRGVVGVGPLFSFVSLSLAGDFSKNKTIACVAHHHHNFHPPTHSHIHTHTRQLRPDGADDGREPPPRAAGPPDAPPRPPRGQPRYDDGRRRPFFYFFLC